MKKTLLAFALQVLGMAALKAQQIKGVVKDEQGNAITNATVSLLKARDSSIVKLELSKDGNFSFNGVARDSFLISISYVGHEIFYSAKFSYEGSTLEVPVSTLRSAKANLQSVIVTSKKKVIDVKPDKTVLNVEGTVNSTGGDALELLRRSPGVTVDKDEKLSVNGRNGVELYVDNKPLPLNGQDLSTYLKSIPSAQIESIEIINNPGVMYEASGSGGIINIHLKKNKALGFNASVNAGLSVGKNARWEDGFSVNYRNNRINAYGSYSGNYGKLESQFELQRIIKDTAFDQHTQILLKKENQVFKTGLDYTLSTKSNLGFMISGNINAPEVTNKNTTPISYYPTGTIDKILVAQNQTRQTNTNINGNVNYSYKDSSGKGVVINGDYGYYSNKQDQTQPNSFFDATGKRELYQRNYQISSPTRINIYSLKADYEQNFMKGKLALGGKITYVKTDNDFRQYSETGSQWVLDKDRSNFFGYKENVNAAYISYSRILKGVVIQGGLRAEETYITGTMANLSEQGSQYGQVISFKRNYLDLFPSANITIAPKSQNQFTLSYGRRIDRPVYQDLNPFEYRINEYTYHKGSIYLRPQYTNSISLTYTFRYKLNTTLSYSHGKDVFGQLVDTAQGVKGYLINSNIASQDIASLNISYPFQLKNYSLFTNVNAYYSAYKADLGTGRTINLDVWAVNIYAQNSYSFGKGWSAEVTGFYTSPSIWQATLKAKSMWSADAGIKKQILNGNGTITASVSDVFKSTKWRATSDFAGQTVKAAGSYESRQFKLSFTYLFGNKNVKAIRQYKTGLEDEMNRTQSSGGLGH